MVTREDVIGCYKFILGREPESEEAIRGHLHSGARDIDELRLVFIHSEEFLRKVNLQRHQLLAPQLLPSNRIDCEASGGDMALLLQRIQKEWEELGRTEPHWSVLTAEQFKADQFGTNEQLFFEFGRDIRMLISAFLDRHDIKLSAFPVCFELGCGVGRITLHLAQMSGKVIAADISKVHLALASQELKRRGMENVEFVTLDSPLAVAGLGNFDLFCSFIVFQHNPPPVMKFLLRSILEKLNPGGVAVFQIPVWHEGYVFDLQEYLKNPKSLDMEMHVLPQSQVFEVINSCDCRAVEVREDDWVSTSPAWLSNTFYVVKS